MKKHLLLYVRLTIGQKNDLIHVQDLPESIHLEIEFILKQQISELIDLLENLMINALDLSKLLKGLIDQHINSNFQNHGKAYTLFSMNHIHSLSTFMIFTTDKTTTSSTYRHRRRTRV